MNSKFTPIAKVRKQQRDMVETRLAKTRFEKHELEQELISTCKEIDETLIPTSGDISLMNMARERLGIIRRAKDILQEKLLVKEAEINQLREKYKRANIEFEKIKYLEEQDFAEWMEKLKRDESLNLDEISNILFVNKGQK
jgi:flagellar export protein FliJ